MAAAASIVAMQQILSEQEFFKYIESSPDFAQKANKQLKTGALLGLGTGGATMLGFLAGGPVGAAIGGGIALLAGQRLPKEPSLLQLLLQLEHEERTVVWLQVSSKLGPGLTRAIVAQHSSLIAQIISTVFENRQGLHAPEALGSAQPAAAPASK